jgi:hypothetical protein
VAFQSVLAMVRRMLRQGTLRGLQVRLLAGRIRQREEADVRGHTISGAEVSFEVRQEQGCPYIALVLTREGKPAAGDKMFTLELVPDLTPEEVEMLAQALNRCVTHLGMAGPNINGEGV